MAASQDLPTKGEEKTGGEVIPSKGEGDSPASQSFEETLFCWSWVLKDSDKLLPLTKEQKQNLTTSVTCSYLFLHFHLIFHYFSVLIFISSGSF